MKKSSECKSDHAWLASGSVEGVESWSEICSSFDPDQETKNFGTRHAFEAVGNVFDVFTLATLQPKVRQLLTTLQGVNQRVG